MKFPKRKVTNVVKCGEGGGCWIDPGAGGLRSRAGAGGSDFHMTGIDFVFARVIVRSSEICHGTFLAPRVCCLSSALSCLPSLPCHYNVVVAVTTTFTTVVMDKNSFCLFVYCSYKYKIKQTIIY